jgi:uncharacterized protein (DUF697 family)
MTRKPLPKAITRSIANLQGIVGDFVANEQGRVPRQTTQFDAVEPEPTAEILPASSQSAAQNTAGITTRPAAAVAEAPIADPLAAKRRALARRIVDRHGTYASFTGLSPLPIVNVAGVTGIIMRMVKQLSELYQVPLQRDRTRSVIVGLVGGAVPTGIGATAASTLGFIMPGAGLIGLAICAISAGTLTRSIGLVFVDSFENVIAPDA